MSNWNWFDYVDGRLTQEVHREAEQALATDESLRAKVDQMKAFVHAVKAEGMSQPVPLAELHAKIPRPKKISHLFWAVPLAASLLFLGVFTLNRPTHEEHEFSSYKAAAGWVEERTHFAVPVVQIDGATLVSAERTADSGCYCMLVDGHLIHLSYQKRTPEKEGFGSQKLAGYDVRVKGSVVAFESRGLSWSIHGDNLQENLKVAESALRQL